MQASATFSLFFSERFAQAAFGLNERCINTCSHLKHLLQVSQAYSCKRYFVSRFFCHNSSQRKNIQGEGFLWQRDVTADPPEDVGEEGIMGLQPEVSNNIDEFTLWLHCMAAYFQIGSAQKSKGLEALERAKACVPADSPLLLLCSARVAELQGHKDDALQLYTSAVACSVASASSHPLIRYHSPELYLGRWYDVQTPP
jgi:hypothetical protein